MWVDFIAAHWITDRENKRKRGKLLKQDMHHLCFWGPTPTASRTSRERSEGIQWPKGQRKKKSKSISCTHTLNKSPYFFSSLLNTYVIVGVPQQTAAHIRLCSCSFFLLSPSLPCSTLSLFLFSSISHTFSPTSNHVEKAILSSPLQPSSHPPDGVVNIQSHFVCFGKRKRGN